VSNFLHGVEVGELEKKLRFHIVCPSESENLHLHPRKNVPMAPEKVLFDKKRKAVFATDSNTHLFCSKLLAFSIFSGGFWWVIESAPK